MLIRVDVEDAAAADLWFSRLDGRRGRAAPRSSSSRTRWTCDPRCLSSTTEPTAAPAGVETRELDQEIRSSFLDYAMSVIVSRALPDVRDGLKPVHRRVLYAMHEAGLQPNRPTRKSARVVGDVMGNYHPHGDSAIYDALVRLAQPFSLRYPLIDGQGYFGSVDGDPAGGDALHGVPALAHCHGDAPGHRRRHRRLPAELRRVAARAVGAAGALPEPARQRLVRASPSAWRRTSRRTTSARSIDAIVAMIDDPDIDVERLSQHVKGPDFPTGGSIVGRGGIRDAYRSGRGRITCAAARTSSSCAAARARSSSPSFRTASARPAKAA